MSMPILGELLQYDASHRETTMRKAEAVERLCGRWALAYPGRLIATEIVAAACELGLISDRKQAEILSSDRFWYPDISDVFSGLNQRIITGAISELDTMGIHSRVARRQAKKLAKKIDVASFASKAAPQMAEKYGLPIDVITRSIVALLKGRSTPEEASHTLFRAIAEPKKFVEMYFEKVETDRNLPSWIGGLGRDIEHQLITMRERLNPYLAADGASQILKNLLANWPMQLAKIPFSIVAAEIAALGIDTDQSATLASDPKFVARVPSAQIMGQVVTAYVRQILGQNASIEHSFGGDLIHALYLPYVDLWRGDRRFSSIISSALPAYSDRIIAVPKNLPTAIDNWNAGTKATQAV